MKKHKKFMYLTDLGFIPAFNILAKIYYDKKDYKEAWKLYKRSADLGNSEMFHHGRILKIYLQLLHYLSA